MKEIENEFGNRLLFKATNPTKINVQGMYAINES